MKFFQRPPTTWPYAASSTGRLRGSLNLGILEGRVQVYDAIGEARQISMDKLSKDVVKLLNDNGDRLQECGSFVDMSLFMMGKSIEKTKPMVMIVSDDRHIRLEAFKMVKDSNILESYLGYGLSHMSLKAEFEDL